MSWTLDCCVCTLRCCWPDTGELLETTWALVTISPLSDITKPEPLDRGMVRPNRGCLGGNRGRQRGNKGEDRGMQGGLRGATGRTGGDGGQQWRQRGNMG